MTLKTSRKFLDLGIVDYIASDAHDMDERAGHMEQCYTFIRKKYGEDITHMLFEKNPGKIFARKRV